MGAKDNTIIKEHYINRSDDVSQIRLLVLCLFVRCKPTSVCQSFICIKSRTQTQSSDVTYYHKPLLQKHVRHEILSLSFQEQFVT